MSDVKLEVYDPSGGLTIEELRAPRLDILEGKTICELTTGSFEYDKTSPVIREALQKRFPTAKFIPYTELPIGIAPIDSDKTADMVKAKGCQAVIVGNAG